MRVWKEGKGRQTQRFLLRSVATSLDECIKNLMDGWFFSSLFPRLLFLPLVLQFTFSFSWISVSFTSLITIQSHATIWRAFMIPYAACRFWKLSYHTNKRGKVTGGGRNLNVKSWTNWVQRTARISFTFPNIKVKFLCGDDYVWRGVYSRKHVSS